jgi:uncharacterized protein YifN (PemK superfamily)
MSPHDRARLRAETQCDDATIRRWARGDRVQDASRVRLTRAARVLGIRLPERAAPKEPVS